MEVLEAKAGELEPMDGEEEVMASEAEAVDGGGGEGSWAAAAAAVGAAAAAASGSPWRGRGGGWRGREGAGAQNLAPIPGFERNDSNHTSVDGELIFSQTMVRFGYHFEIMLIWECPFEK